MEENLTERQRQILSFIGQFLDERHFPPTIREIAKAVGISSTSVVKYNLDILRSKNLIERDGDISRGIRLVEEAAQRAAGVIRVPVLGRIAAGEPIPVPESTFSPFGYDRGIDLTRDIVRDQKDIYALEVKGNSMIDALINDGDIVVMRHQERVENGELAAVWLRSREESTLKRFYLEGSEGERVRLQPANPTMGPMFFPTEEVEVRGKVLLVIRKVN